MWYGYKTRVELLVDLTKYDLRLTIGQQGYMLPDIAYSKWARGSDHFGAVVFDCGARLDIATNSVKFLKTKKDGGNKA